MHITQLNPPRRLHATAIPNILNIGTEANGKQTARRDREHAAAAWAEAENIS